MFSNTAASQKFGEGFEAAMQREDEARQRALEEAQERERQRQLEEQRTRFIEQTATAWEKTWGMKDQGAAKSRQDDLIGEVSRAAELYGVGFDDLAKPINERTHEIKAERERQREIELGLERERSRGHGLSL